MIALIFLFSVAGLFALLFLAESAIDSGQRKRRPIGLVTWLTSGNWPAKVGAGLLLIGIGALLRYALIHLNLPPEFKLGSGFIAAAILAAGAFLLRAQAERRAIYLALAGTAAGVAYLTAYSAYGFFGFITDVKALTLLTLVALATGIFAVSSHAVSIGILAMAGAYLAPAFALTVPGPLPVYGYYLAVSFLSFIMVAIRSWRGLIHLSFLFTLAGSLFFGWTARFYHPEYYLVMQPMLLALTALHLAMPLVERRANVSRWLARFDVGYFVALPVVAAVLTLLIAPRLHDEGAFGLFLLASLWMLTAVLLRMVKRDEALRYACMALALFATAGVCRLHDVPWMLVFLALAVASFVLEPRLGLPRKIDGLLCGIVLLLGFLHISASLLETSFGTIILNEVFAKRMTAVLLLTAAAWVGRRREIKFAGIVGLTAACWVVLAMGLELQRLQIDLKAQIVYGLLLVGALGVAIAGHRATLPAALVASPALVLMADGWWATQDAPLVLIIVFLVLTFLILLIVAIFNIEADYAENSGSAIILGLLPLTLLPWVIAAMTATAVHTYFLGAAILACGALLSLITARRCLYANTLLNDVIWPLYFLAITVGLGFATTLHIERSVWAVVFDALALAYLIVFAAFRMDEREENLTVFETVAIIAISLVLQAMLLRLFGPDRVMTVSDLTRMKFPAMVSLLWAVIGAILAGWGAKISSRALWSAGALLLVVAAVKLSLIDFGSLGDIGNILAMIAAGLVFLAVAWLAPPPKRVNSAKGRSGSRPRPTIKTATSHPQDDSSAPQASGEKRQYHPKSQSSGSPRRKSDSKETQTIGGKRGLLLLVIFVTLMALPFLWRHLNHFLSKSSPSIVRHRSEPQPAPPTKISPVPDKTARVTTHSAGPLRTAPQRQPIKVIDACTVFHDRLPADFHLYAGGAYGGRKLGYSIDQSGHEATRFDVYVDEPGQQVVLALGAYEPSVWNIHCSPKTSVVGVFVSGYHRQQVHGLGQEVPLLNSSFKERAACGYFYLDRRNPAKADFVVRKVFGRSAESYFVTANGRIEIGARASEMSRKDLKAEEDTGESVQLAGQAGLNQLLRNGKLRPATPQDFSAWQQVSESVHHSESIGGDAFSTLPRVILGRAYVVLESMQFPAGLYGAHAVTFIIAKGVPMPSGNPGHSSVLDMNTGTYCIGALCR